MATTPNTSIWGSAPMSFSFQAPPPAVPTTPPFLGQTMPIPVPERPSTWFGGPAGPIATAFGPQQPAQPVFNSGALFGAPSIQPNLNTMIPQGPASLGQLPTGVNGLHGQVITPEQYAFYYPPNQPSPDPSTAPATSIWGGPTTFSFGPSVSTPTAPAPPQTLSNPEAAGLTNMGNLISALMPTVGGAYNPAMEAAWNAAKGAGGVNAFQSGAQSYLDKGSGLSAAEQSALATAQQLIGLSGNNPFAQEAAGFARTGAQMSDAERAALEQLGLFNQGALGSSPATQAAMSAFNQFSVPEIQQQLALAGLGRSGAVGTSIAEAQARAAVPLLQTEMANRMQSAGLTADIGQAERARQIQAAGVMAGLGEMEINALLNAAGVQANVGGAQQGRTIQAGNIMGNIGQNVGQQALESANIRANLGTAAANNQLQAAQLAASIASQQAGVGNTLAERARADTRAALEAAGIPREIAAQQAEAMYKEFLRQMGLSVDATLGPIGGGTIPGMFGQTTSGGGGGMFGS